MRKRVEGVVDAAMERSRELLDALPENRRTHRVNAERIVAVCKELVTTKPPQEPVAPLVAERGAVLYGKFPAAQSLLNRYRDLLRVWREAYTSIVDLTVPIPAKAADSMALLEQDLSGLDSGTKARMAVVIQMLREQKRENDRLRHLIREQIPAPRRDAGDQPPPSLPPQYLSALKAWLDALAAGNSGLEMDKVGVRVSRHARPGRVVIPLEVVEAVRALCEAPRSLTAPDSRCPLFDSPGGSNSLVTPSVPTPSSAPPPAGMVKPGRKATAGRGAEGGLDDVEDGGTFPASGHGCLVKKVLASAEGLEPPTPSFVPLRLSPPPLGVRGLDCPFTIDRGPGDQGP